MGFRSYLTESIRLHAQGKYFQKSLDEMMRHDAVPQRTVDDIVAEVTRRAGLEVVEDGDTA